METMKRAAELSQYIADARHHIHAFPETGFEEVETSAFIERELSALGLKVRRMEPTGVMAEICGAQSGGKTVLLRADMDALPMAEKTGLDYASTREGVFHGCGHDSHAAMLLGAARLLVEARDGFAGRVRLIFQPGEETGLGALRMIEQGVLDQVDMCFAEHILPQYPLGAVYCGAGRVMAGAGTFTVTVTGRAAHGAQPENGADALLCGAATALALQTIASREVAPDSPFTLNIGTLHAGDRYNIVAGHAVLEGTARMFDRTLLEGVGERIARIASGTAASYRCEADTKYSVTCESLITDSRATALARRAAQQILPDPAKLNYVLPTMGSEDFAFFSAKAPCAFAYIGCGGEYPLHSERFTVDDGALLTGAALYAQTALEFLKG